MQSTTSSPSSAKRDRTRHPSLTLLQTNLNPSHSHNHSLSQSSAYTHSPLSYTSYPNNRPSTHSHANNGHELQDLAKSNNGRGKLGEMTSTQQEESETDTTTQEEGSTKSMVTASDVPIPLSQSNIRGTATSNQQIFQSQSLQSPLSTLADSQTQTPPAIPSAKAPPNTSLARSRSNVASTNDTATANPIPEGTHDPYISSRLSYLNAVVPPVRSKSDPHPGQILENEEEDGNGEEDEEGSPNPNSNLHPRDFAIEDQDQFDLSTEMMKGLDEVMSLQQEIAAMHSGLEIIEGSGSGSGDWETPEDQTGRRRSSAGKSKSPGKGIGKEKEKDGKEDTGVTASALEKREQGVLEIIAKLGQLSKSLQQLHQIPHPTLFFPSPFSTEGIFNEEPDFLPSISVMRQSEVSNGGGYEVPSSSSGMGVGLGVKGFEIGGGNGSSSLSTAAEASGSGPTGVEDRDRIIASSTKDRDPSQPFITSSPGGLSPGISPMMTSNSRLASPNPNNGSDGVSPLNTSTSQFPSPPSKLPYSNSYSYGARPYPLMAGKGRKRDQSLDPIIIPSQVAASGSGHGTPVGSGSPIGNGPGSGLGMGTPRSGSRLGQVGRSWSTVLG